MNVGIYSAMLHSWCSSFEVRYMKTCWSIFDISASTNMPFHLNQMSSGLAAWMACPHRLMLT